MTNLQHAQEKSCEIVFFFYADWAMNEFKETTAANLRSIREEKKLSQDDVASLLGVEKYSISRIENGNRALSDSEKTILDWYFFGIMPPRLVGGNALQGMLEFTPAEWRIIGILARREGLTERQWIVSRVRASIEFSGLSPTTLQSLPAGAPDNAESA